MKKVLITIGVIIAVIIVAFLIIKLVEYGSSLSTRGPEGFFIPYQNGKIIIGMQNMYKAHHC